MNYSALPCEMDSQRSAYPRILKRNFPSMCACLSSVTDLMGIGMSADVDRLVKVSFSFYPADMDTLVSQTQELKKLGAAVRRGTVLRAMIELTSETEMFAYTVLLHRDYVAKAGPREIENVAGIPTVDLPPRLVRKLDQVITELAAKGIKATRAYVVRAVLRNAPQPTAWINSVNQYLKDFPRKSRVASSTS